MGVHVGVGIEPIAYATALSAELTVAVPALRRAEEANRLDRVTLGRIFSRLMSSPSDVERQRLDCIADDLREAFSERGHRVDVALEVDPAFGSGRSRSSLMNDLVLDAVARSASTVGVYFQPVNGTGRELIGVQHRYRIRRAKRDATDKLVITVSSESSLGLEEDPTLYPMGNWVFGWITNAEGLIAEVFAAEVLGIIPGTPGRLILGDVLALGSGGPGSDGFIPVEEDLDLDLGFDGEEDEDGIGA